jgi:hypothetical protein
MGEERGAHRLLVEKPEGKSPSWRPRLRWEDNIKIDLQEVGVGRWGPCRYVRCAVSTRLPPTA